MREAYLGGDVHYENLDHPVPYTGGLLLARGFIRELYVHMGFHPAWKYEEVQELAFREGKLLHARDRSEEMAEFRREVANAPLEPGHGVPEEQIRSWIVRAFSLEYDRGEASEADEDEDEDAPVSGKSDQTG